MDYRTVISENIKRRMKELKITQNELAEKIGVKQAAISKWCLGTQAPDTDLLVPVCEALSLSLNELFGVDDINEDVLEAMKLYQAYQEHPDVRGSIDILLELNK